MANYTLSPNMSLPVPTIGVETGPDYATDINNSLSLIDTHDHTSGKGVLLTPAALNINSDLTFANNSATNVKGVKLYTQTVSPGNKSVWTKGSDLYFTDSTGADVRLTSSGAVAKPNLNYTISSSCGYFSFSPSTVPGGNSDVTNLSASLTSSGGLMEIKLIPTTDSYIQSNVHNSPYQAQITIRLMDASSNVLASEIFYSDISLSVLSIPASTISFIHQPSAGAVNYKINVLTNHGGTDTVIFNNIKLFVREL